MQYSPTLCINVVPRFACQHGGSCSWWLVAAPAFVIVADAATPHALANRNRSFATGITIDTSTARHKPLQAMTVRAALLWNCLLARYLMACHTDVKVARSAAPQSCPDWNLSPSATIAVKPFDFRRKAQKEVALPTSGFRYRLETVVQCFARHEHLQIAMPQAPDGRDCALPLCSAHLLPKALAPQHFMPLATHGQSFHETAVREQSDDVLDHIIKKRAPKLWHGRSLEKQSLNSPGLLLQHSRSPLPAPHGRLPIA
mmetsp:Transcript_10608/g.19587  ORF Transcript_10608/g.19587 Transcript_10608/m.19587 type:complete len:257 (-) Transcript_10608:69-839(-)